MVHLGALTHQRHNAGLVWKIDSALQFCSLTLLISRRCHSDWSVLNLLFALKYENVPF